MVIGTLFFVASCKDSTADVTLSNTDAVVSSKRLEFTKGKNMDVIKDDYRRLSEDKKKELWVDKLHQIQSQPLSPEQLTLVQELETEVTRNGSEFLMENEKIRAIGLRLAAITPRENFVQMFSSLEDYKYSGGSKTGVCNECIADMQTENVRNPLGTRSKPCNCNWTCDSVPGSSTSNCEPTGSGCGFLWLSSCRKRACIEC